MTETDEGVHKKKTQALPLCVTKKNPCAFIVLNENDIRDL
jgi:hypothetical protein